MCYNRFVNVLDILKNQDFFHKLEEKHANGTLASSTLFFCEDSKTSEYALYLSALMIEYQMYELMNERSAEFLRIENDADLDIKVYPKNGDKLLVADANEIVGETFIKPTNHPNKVFIIKNIDKSTEQAQNKLLKVLEEPPQNVYYLISASNKERVLPTICSRCDKVTIGKMEFGSEFSPLVKMLCGGYIGRAESLSKNRDLDEVADFAVKLVCELKNSSQVLLFSKEFQGYKDDIALILKIYLFCLEDIVKIKSEKEELVTMKIYVDKLKMVESEFSVYAICEIEKIISHFMEKLEFNALIPVAIDNLLLKILEVKYLCK